MFTALLLICTSNMSLCYGQSSTTLAETQDECYKILGEGIKIYEQQGYVIKNYQCVYWGEKA